MASTINNNNQIKLSDYNIDTLQYPADLGAADNYKLYGGHRVVFFINAQGGGHIVRDNKAEFVDMPKSRWKEFAGENAVEALDKSVSALKGKSEIIDKTLEAVHKVVAPKRRLKSVINLYVPNNITKSYNVSWGEEDEGMVSGDLKSQAILGATEFLQGKTGAGKESLEKLGKQGMAAIVMNQLAGMNYLQKSIGVTPGNAKAEMLFKGVDFNSIQLDYSFAPRDEAEAKKVLNIIRTFRHHMLPEYIGPDNFLFIYPSEFEIRYYRGTTENEYLERHMTCVLKNVTINYTPNGQFTTFANGMPTHINMTLSFQELGIPTKETSPTDQSGA